MTTAAGESHLDLVDDAPGKEPPVAVAARIAAAVAACPDVARLYDGAVGEIATYGRGRRVGGVRMMYDTSPRIEVHIVVRYGRPLPDIAEAVRAEVEQQRGSGALADAAVNVHIADLDDTLAST